MYNLNRNNYHLKPKNSTIYTPPTVSQFLFELLKDKIKQNSTILDPCCGMNSLLEPWQKQGYKTYGIDIDAYTPSNYTTNFLLIDPAEIQKGFTPSLILCNPPFNGYGQQLGSEMQSIENTSIAIGQVWLAKILELFGKNVPIVLFAPIGFRMNLTLASHRYHKFANGEYPEIKSSITLPKNIFKDVIFHSEILIFNIPNLQPHYFFKNYQLYD